MSYGAGGRMLGSGAGRTSGPGGGGGRSAGRGKVVTTTGAGSCAGVTPAAASTPMIERIRPNARPMIGPRTRGNGSGRRHSGGRDELQEHLSPKRKQGGRLHPSLALRAQNLLLFLRRFLLRGR